MAPGHGEQRQGVALALKPQAIAGGDIVIADPQRIAIAVEVAAADSAEVEAVEGRIDQAIASLLPALRRGLELLEHEQLPALAAHRLPQDGQPLLLEGLALEDARGRLAAHQACAQESEARPREVASLHGISPGLLTRAVLYRMLGGKPSGE